MHSRHIEIEVECTPEQLPAAIQQVANVIAQIEMPGVIRQVFYELPAASQVAFQLPNLSLQKLPLLENKNG